MFHYISFHIPGPDLSHHIPIIFVFHLFFARLVPYLQQLRFSNQFLRSCCFLLMILVMRCLLRLVIVGNAKQSEGDQFAQTQVYGQLRPFF